MKCTHPSSRVFLDSFQALSMDTPMMKYFGREYFGPIERSNPMKTYGRKFTTYYVMVLKLKGGCSTKEKLATRMLCWMSYLFPLLHWFHWHTRTDFLFYLSCVTGTKSLFYLKCKLLGQIVQLHKFGKFPFYRNNENVSNRV